MRPSGPRSTIRRSITSGCGSTTCAAAVEWLTAQGMRFTPGGIRKGAAGYDVCFIHPKGNDEFPLSGEGVLIELVQAPADVIAALK